MELEKVLVIRPDGGRLAAVELIVAPSYADGLTAELLAAAASGLAAAAAGEDVMVVRADGEELQTVAVQVPSEVADRIIGDALAERVL